MRPQSTAQGTLLSALWWPKWEGNPKKEGICVYVWLIHFVGEQKITQHSKATILQYFLFNSAIWGFERFRVQGEGSMFQMMLYKDKWDQSMLSFAGTANNLGHYPKSNGVLHEGFEQEHHMSRFSFWRDHFGVDAEKDLEEMIRSSESMTVVQTKKTVAWMRMVKREEVGFKWWRRDMVRLQTLRGYKGQAMTWE